LYNPVITYNEEISVNYTADHGISQDEKMARYWAAKYKKIVDAGCGTGRILQYLPNGIGIEPSETQFLAIPANIRDRAINAPYSFNLVSALNPDAVLFSFSIHQIFPNLDDQLSELHRLVDRGMTVLLMTVVQEYLDQTWASALSEEVYRVDSKRFISLSTLAENFKVEISSSFDTEDSKETLMKIRRKHVSALHLISQEALDELAKVVASRITCPICVNYISLSKK
jgi:SAM-dependent methyltransferase